MTKKTGSDRRNIRPMTVNAPPPPLPFKLQVFLEWGDGSDNDDVQHPVSCVLCLEVFFESSWFLISRRNSQKKRFWREFGWFLPPTFHHEFHFIYRTQSIHDAIGNVFHSLIVVSVLALSQLDNRRCW